MHVCEGVSQKYLYLFHDVHCSCLNRILYAYVIESRVIMLLVLIIML